MRKCIKCETSESSNWYRGPLCKGCYNKRWQRDNKEKVRNSSAKYRKNNREKDNARHKSPKSRFTQAKNYAMQRGKTWNIVFDDFCTLIDKNCYYCNNNLGPKETYGVGLDRIDNSIGYELSNVLTCCKICNSIRNNYLTIDETKVAVNAILEHRKIGAENL